jgi:hypothetical protein
LPLALQRWDIVEHFDVRIGGELVGRDHDAPLRKPVSVFAIRAALLNTM